MIHGIDKKNYVLEKSVTKSEAYEIITITSYNLNH